MTKHSLKLENERLKLKIVKLKARVREYEYDIGKCGVCSERPTKFYACSECRHPVCGNCFISKWGLCVGCCTECCGCDKLQHPNHARKCIDCKKSWCIDCKDVIYLSYENGYKDLDCESCQGYLCWSSCLKTHLRRHIHQNLVYLALGLQCGPNELTAVCHSLKTLLQDHYSDWSKTLIL